MLNAYKTNAFSLRMKLIICGLLYVLYMVYDNLKIMKIIWMNWSFVLVVTLFFNVQSKVAIKKKTFICNMRVMLPQNVFIL